MGQDMSKEENDTDSAGASRTPGVFAADEVCQISRFRVCCDEFSFRLQEDTQDLLCITNHPADHLALGARRMA